MQVSFLKMHGAGNDFAVFDARETSATLGLSLGPDRIRLLADRRLGIGCDQLIVLEPGGADAGAFMRIYNPDGSEAGACGNATRCVASLLYAEGQAGPIAIRTISGLLPSVMLADGRVQVDMGVPRLDWGEIPLAGPADTLHLPLPGDPAGASMGNPHATLFVADAETHPVTEQGPALEHDPIFPDRANIGFAQILAPDRMRLRVWERGAGLTLACGSGACAAVVNAHRRGLTGRRVQVIVDGGVLEIAWREDDHVLMTGPATIAYRGTVDL